MKLKEKPNAWKKYMEERWNRFEKLLRYDKKKKLKLKEQLKPKRIVKVAGVVFLAFILTDFLFFCFETLNLELYVTYVQHVLFRIFLFLSFLILLIFLIKRKFLKALLGFLFPLLIYLLINFIFETILYASEIFKVRESLSLEQLILKNINVGIGDLKIVLTIIAIIVWCFVWLKLKEKQ
jgi:hypothetical protein